MSLYKKYLSVIASLFWKRIDEDGKWNNQCVDFVRRYAKDLGYPITTSWNAKDFATKWLWKSWQKITWEAWVGDIVVFPIGTYGHIAVVEKVEWKTLYVVEQNRDWKAFAWNNPNSFGSPVSHGKYILKWNEVFFRVKS